MRANTLCVVAASLLSFNATVDAAVFTFDTDPFAGSTALTTPGRQIVGGEPSITFLPATDVFALDSSVFGVGNQVNFANDVVANLPSSGVNVVVLQTTDNDADPNTAFGAGNAAVLIAAQITSLGPGLFIYFNSGLNLPRLVYSTDLDDNTADLKILARMTNLVGQTTALPDFSASNFNFVSAQVPEPSSLLLVSLASLTWGGLCALRRRRELAHCPNA